MVNLLTLPEWTWDKLCASYLAVRCLFPKQSIAELSSLPVHVCFADEDNLPADVVDVDVRRDYKSSGHGSATEKMAEAHGLSDEELPGLDHLCQILAENNRRGHLKDEKLFPGSLVGLIRVAYRVPRNSELRTFRLGLVYKFWQVVDTYFRAVERDGKVATMDNPFTLSGYARMLRVVGYGDPEVSEALGVFQDLFERVAAREDKAAVRADRIEATSFSVRVTGSTSQVTGHLIETDDSRVAGKYFREHPEMVLLIVRRKSNPRRCVIFCRGRQDFGPLYAALESREPGRWFLDERPQSPQLLNGSDSRSAEASQLPPREIMAVIQQYYEHTPRRLQ